MYFWVGCCRGGGRDRDWIDFCKGLTLLMNKYNMVILKLFSRILRILRFL